MRCGGTDLGLGPFPISGPLLHAAALQPFCVKPHCAAIDNAASLAVCSFTRVEIPAVMDCGVVRVKSVGGVGETVVRNDAGLPCSTQSLPPRAWRD